MRTLDYIVAIIQHTMIAAEHMETIIVINMMQEEPIRHNDMKKRINILIMPTDLCNLECRYCFHVKSQNNSKMMTTDTAFRIIDLASSEYEKVNIIWHGGEPLLAPLSFYQKVYEYIETKTQTDFTFGIQTNGTLLTKDIVSFFSENRTNISISYDGLINEETRGHTFEVFSGINNLSYKPGAIMVVSSLNVHKLPDSYEHFKSIGLSMKLNPLFLDGRAKSNRYLGLNIDEYIKYFTEFFFYWIKDKSCTIRVPTCIDYATLLTHQKSSICTYNSCLGNWLSINSVGNVFTCERMTEEENILANINNVGSINEIFQSKRFTEILQDAITRRKECISNCEYYNMCKGGCNASAYLAGDLCKNDYPECKIHKGILKILLNDIHKFINPTANDSTLNPYFVKVKSK